MTVTIVVVALAVVVGIKSHSLKEKQQQYLEKEQSLIEQVDEENRRAEELEEYRVYVQTRQYIEKVAREKLGLVYPGEILLKPEE